MSSEAPIGIFDSGAGGISVLKAAIASMPHENFVYYGDSKNLPYGDKTEAQVRTLASNAFELLLSSRAKAIVIACNTATGAAAEVLRCKYDIPIIGMEPALKPATKLRKNGVILVMATVLTIKSKKYSRLYETYGKYAISVPCPGLIDFVENLYFEGDILKEYLDNLFKPFLGIQKIDAVVLGCTHYVFLRKAIISALPKDTPVIDGNDGTVRELQRRLATECLLNDSFSPGRIEVLSSDGNQSKTLMENLLHRNIE